jgi:FkbM family methyltransferase
MIKAIVKQILTKLGYEVRHKSVKQKARGNPYVFYDLKKSGFNPSCIIDIGANRGTYSEKVSQIWPDAEIFLFEPLQRHQKQLNDFCARHGKATWFGVGVGSHNKEMTFQVIDQYYGETSTFSELESNRKNLYNTTTVDVITLDNFLEKGKISQPNLIKIDTEGFELEVLKGANNTLQLCDFLQIEVNEHPIEYLKYAPKLSELLAFCESSGFKLYDFLNISYHPKDGEIWLMDIIMKNMKKYS